MQTTHESSLLVQSIRLLQIRKFANWKVADLHSRLNVIIGPNAQGKTTILESLFLGTHLKSFRTNRLVEMVQEGTTQASISLELQRPTSARIVIGLEEGRKVLKVNDQKISSVLKYPYLGGSVSFVPDDLYLIKGGPDGRRQLMDDMILGVDSQYAQSLQKFEKVLKQRNKLLKAIREGQSRIQELGIWTDEFVQSALPLYELRQKLVFQLRELLPQIYKQLFQVDELTNLVYEHNLSAGVDFERGLYDKLNQLGEAERAVGHTLVGPHRDDLSFKIRGMDAKTYGSQGQIRGLVIALKVAQLELTRKYRVWSPILLLDDIISELDDKRVRSLVDYLAQYPGQLFVTTAEVNKVRSLHSQFSSFKIIDLAPEKMPSHSEFEPVYEGLKSL